MRGEGVEVSLNFFPVSRKSDFFFMRLPVGSVVFVSHRRKRVVFRVCKVLGKYEGENETYIEASVENSSSILYDKEIRNKPRTRRTKRNV